MFCLDAPTLALAQEVLEGTEANERLAGVDVGIGLRLTVDELPQFGISTLVQEESLVV